MKIIFCTMFFFCSFVADAQMNKRGLTVNDLKNLPGIWTGTKLDTIEKTQVTYTSNLEIVDMMDSLLLNIINTGSAEKKTTVKYAMRIYEDGNKLSFNSSDYDILSVKRRGQRLTIIAERDGVDNNESANFRITITIGLSNFNFTEEIKKTNVVEYVFRSRSVYTKK